MGQGIRFFNRSYSDITRLDLEEILISVTNNNDFKTFMVDRDPFTRYQSSGANDDLITVELTVDFLQDRFISDLILVDTNLKDFELQQWDSGSMSYVTVLTETANTANTVYKTFTGLTTDKVKLKMNKTIVADQEKYLNLFIITSEIGQLEYRPFPRPDHDGNIIENKMIDGKSKFVFNQIQHNFEIEFSGYTNINDRQLLQTLSDLKDSFLIWPCGGDEAQFSYADEGWRLEDIYLVNRSNQPSPFFTKNYYKAGTNARLLLKEVS